MARSMFFLETHFTAFVISDYPHYWHRVLLWNRKNSVGKAEFNRTEYVPLHNEIFNDNLMIYFSLKMKS